MPRERKTRRKSVYVRPKYDPALGPPPDAMEKDEVESLYADQRTHYKAPEDRELETLFEGKDADNEGNAEEENNGHGGGRRPKRKVCGGLKMFLTLLNILVVQGKMSKETYSLVRCKRGAGRRQVFGQEEAGADALLSGGPDQDQAQGQDEQEGRK